MPQTKFVTAKALALGLKPIVVINKLDRPDARPDYVIDAVFDLFVALDATDEQLDFPILYASGRSGWASLSADEDKRGDSLAPMFEVILNHVPAPAQLNSPAEAPLRMLVTVLSYDPYLGRILTGRIEEGQVVANQQVVALEQDGTIIERAKVTKVLAYRGLERVSVDKGQAGDIVALAGLSKASVADTIGASAQVEPIAAQPVDPPTVAVTISINDSPFAGRDGDKVQSRVIRDRLHREIEGNVALRVTESSDKDAFEVAGRGELQLGVLIETLRREGFEMSISRPRVLYQKDPVTGQRLEPVEEVVIDVDEAYTGVVIEKLSGRKGQVIGMAPSGGGKTRITAHCPSRGLIGYLGEFLTDTRGTGIMYRLFHDYQPHFGEITGRRSGALISMADGIATPYALWNLEGRGELFITPGTPIYTGMIVGEHARNNDLDVNPLKAKQLTNFRAAGKDDAVKLTTPKQLSLEQAISYINDDELVEATPKNIRLRKKTLNPSFRKSYALARP